MDRLMALTTLLGGLAPTAAQFGFPSPFPFFPLRFRIVCFVAPVGVSAAALGLPAGSVEVSPRVATALGAGGLGGALGLGGLGGLGALGLGGAGDIGTLLGLGGAGTLGSMLAT